MSLNIFCLGGGVSGDRFKQTHINTILDRGQRLDLSFFSWRMFRVPSLQAQVHHLLKLGLFRAIALLAHCKRVHASLGGQHGLYNVNAGRQGRKSAILQTVLLQCRYFYRGPENHHEGCMVLESLCFEKPTQPAFVLHACIASPETAFASGFVFTLCVCSLGSR